MTARTFTTNKNGKIEFTWDELKRLLDDVYNEGREEGRMYTWTPPFWRTPYTSPSINTTISGTNSSDTITISNCPEVYTGDIEKSITYTTETPKKEK